MISEESCDTEDWRKINDILQYIQIYSFTVSNLCTVSIYF